MSVIEPWNVKTRVILFYSTEIYFIPPPLRRIDISRNISDFVIDLLIQDQ